MLKQVNNGGVLMMSRPDKIIVDRKIDLKLGIKSSLPKVKSLVGLVYVLWRLEGKETELHYSDQEEIGIVLKENLKRLLTNYFQTELEESGISEDDFIRKINNNVLFKSQIEALIVALELIWKISRVQFEEEGTSFSRERQGGGRYPKKLLFTKNIDNIDLLYSNNEDQYKKIIFNWIIDADLNVNTNFESALIKAFTLMSEEAIYKIRIDDEKQILFYQSGIYSKLVEGQGPVDITDARENKGSLRILHTILKENLNFYLRKDGSRHVAVQNQSLVLDLTEYMKRVNNYLDLTYIDLDIFDNGQVADSTDSESTESDRQQSGEISKPHNRIIFGAPGTGKSYLVNQDRAEFGDNFERVTFHPTYSYAQFVGTYKPLPIYKDHLDSPRYSTVGYKDNQVESVVRESDEHLQLYPLINEPYITYEFVPGPFLRLLLKAIKNEFVNYLLIIEEINRANVTAVFGDVFQLLDRDDTGKSEYSIMISEEMKAYISRELGTVIHEISLPSNLFIWATMNTADQGVYPMDTAFKRRWSFEYVSLNAGEDSLKDFKVNIKCLAYPETNWNLFRRALNLKLSELNFKEDKLIGPYFIKTFDLETDERFQMAFKNKLLMYLFEDVIKHEKSKFFVESIRTFSDLLEHYNLGNIVFNFSVEELMENQTYLSSESVVE